MRRVFSLLTLVGVACAPRNYHREVSSTVPNGRDVMQCALAEARRFGYEIRENDPQEGTSLAQRPLASAGDSPARFDLLTFEFVSETTSPTTFRVLAVTLVHGGNGREPHYLEPTVNALADQGRVVSSCVQRGD